MHAGAGYCTPTRRSVTCLRHACAGCRIQVQPQPGARLRLVPLRLQQQRSRYAAACQQDLGRGNAGVCGCLPQLRVVHKPLGTAGHIAVCTHGKQAAWLWFRHLKAVEYSKYGAGAANGCPT